MAALAVDPVSPDTSEGRERITRLEERVDSNRRQIEMLGPLPLSVGLIQKGQDDLNEDVRELRKDMDERFQQLDRSFGNRIAACSDEIAKLARALERRDDTRTQDVISRRTLYGVLGAAALAALAAILAPIITAIVGG